MDTLIGRSSKRELMKKTSDQRGMGGGRVIFKNDQQLVVVKVEREMQCARSVFYLYLFITERPEARGG